MVLEGWAGVCVLSMSVGASEPVPQMPPSVVFSPSTSVYVRIRPAGLTAGRVRASIDSTMPASEIFAEARKNGAAIAGLIDQSAFAPLRTTGVEVIHAIGEADGMDLKGATWVMMAHVEDGGDEAVGRFGPIAEQFGFQTRLARGWMIMHRDVFPEADLDVPVYDAPFLEAVQDAPDYDVLMVLVPTAATRATMRQGVPPDEEDPQLSAAVNELTVLADAAWMSVTAELGGSPTITLTVSMADPNACGRAVTAWREMMSAAKRKLREEAAAEAAEDPEKAYDPAPYLRVVSALEPVRKGETFVVELDSREIRYVFNAVELMMTQLGEALGEAIGDAVMPFDLEDDQ